MGGALIRRIALMVLVCAVPVHAVIGDLNLDGVVNLQDFFILADNFGREGVPEVCEDPDTPGDDGGTGPILDATRPPSLWPPSLSVSSRRAAATTPIFR